MMWNLVHLIIFVHLYDFIHSCKGIEKRKNNFKNFLWLVFTHNIKYMKNI